MKTNSREIAFDVLKKVFLNKSFSNILLNEVAKQNLPNKFKNLVFAIVHGTIANKLLVENVTNKLINHKRTNIEVQILLWMSIYQLHFLTSIPQYAVVNESVLIAKAINPKLAGLVNACLKKVIAQEDQLFDFSELPIARQICFTNSFPIRLFKEIENQFGLEIATKIAKDSTMKPVISFRVNTLKIAYETFFDRYQAQFGLIKTNVENCLIAKNPVVQDEIYQTGLITIQDPASISVVNILDPKLNSKVLDMCSAPGGKLTHLAMKMQNTGQIIGYELNKNKIKLIQENIDRLACENITLHCGDATLIDQANEFDHILLDAPCSGFGVLKRKPEIKLNYHDQKSLNSIVETQAKLLETAYFNLKVKGTMVYSTCTINKRENQEQIANFLAKFTDMEIIEEHQLFGYENNTDGFYICKMIKK